MNRRHLLKLIAAAGTGALATGLFLPHAQAAGPSFFLVTDRPEADLASLRAQQAYLEDQTSLSTITLSLQRTSAPPAPQAERPIARPGVVWVAGRYDWQYGDWVWTPGRLPPPEANGRSYLRIPIGAL